ncbi:MAG: DNA mismatch repair endonuclease MutL [Nitrospinae bacterium]|nr:DNA mismatch repair endonuclease MutL [Nitrospinota bacterium]
MTNAAGTAGGSGVRILPDHVANQIAAGEVVERPASIIKELAENSLDAGARSVIVSIRNGGKSYIEVSDDGAGMPRDDAMMAFERHATSKIRDAADLKAVTTLGFRGEALPSIASVSRVILSTAMAGEPAGTDIVIEGGKIRDVRDGAPIKGTRIQVRDLFFNTPARRKFLRGEEVEAAHAKEAAIRIALARPDVAFTFIKEGRPLFSLPAEESASGFNGRVEALFGGDTARNLAAVRFSSGDMEVEGLVSLPGRTRAGSQTQYVYINGRHVKDRLINFAVAEGYRSLIPRGRYPAVFLRISLPPEKVDVNAHPSKTEVRFFDGRAVIALVKGAILQTLVDMKGGASAPVTLADFEPTKDQSPAIPPAREEEDPWAAAALAKRPERPAFCEPPAVFAAEAPGPAPERTTPGEEAAPLIGPAVKRRVIGQVFQSFFLVEEGEKLLIMDQHTVHERILYEKISARYREGRVETQELLFPVEIEFSMREADIMRGHMDDFSRLGLALEEFGGSVFMLRSVPFILRQKDYRAMILDILDTLESGGGAPLDHVAEGAINIMACRGAVKAGQTLDTREIEGLLAQLDGCVLPYTCPHGRPISVTVDREGLYRMFLRK